MVEAIHSAFQKITGKLNDWLTHAIEMLPNFLVAVILLVVFFVLARLADRFLRNTLESYIQKRRCEQPYSLIGFHADGPAWDFHRSRRP